MSENSENKEMKMSGLRPPTKIPTMGVSRLPSSSSIKLDGVHSMTKLDAKKAADMPYVSKYNGFNKKTVDERKSSSGSDSFVGDARRLSEAGVRRSSGNSVVLTEDTDKFIIGNRIWVGGTKPGQIAYIGETNFGNGDWAGVVLDEPIGKNDGSVGGTRYFQCEPKKGVFARLTNLTSAPLSSVEDSMIQSSFATAKPLGFSTPMAPKRQNSAVTAFKTTVPKSINQLPTSKSSSDLKIGDRVIISSGQGSKLGVLRYRGSTQFAPGEWCGIELDDPLGKNNGIVEGIKYFECEDKFGLFTPIAKVSKSPMSSNRMSSNCAIHKSKRSPDSMNGSMISAMTSNTMSSIPTRVRLGVASLSYKHAKISDLDRLKTQLTQMKNENELLRLQVTKAANQADVAEKRLEETLQAQVEKPSETQVNSIIMLQNQLDNMKKQMDEEKEKVQNLQFTNEEQNVVSIELQNKNSELLIKIKELELDLDKERNIAKDVEKEKMKIFEKEEELCRIKEELESLKKVIDNNEDELQKSVSNLSSEVVDKDALLNTLRQTLNENSQTHDRLLKEVNEKLSATTERLNKIIEEKDKKIEQNQEMIDQLNEGIKCLSALKNDEHDDIVNNLKNEFSKLKDEYTATIDKKEEDTKISSENHIKIENELQQQLKSIQENKNQEIEQLQKKYTDLMSSNSSEKNIIEKLKHELQITTNDLKVLKAKNIVYSKENLEAVLQQHIQSTFIKIEDLKKQFDTSLSLKDKQIETCNTTLIQIKEQIINSKSYLESNFNDTIKEKDCEIKILSEKLKILTDDYEQIKKANHNVSIELTTAIQSIQDKTTLISDLKKKYNDLESLQELNRNELEKELTTKLKSINDELTCLKSEKLGLKEKYEHYVKESTNTINDMDNKMKQNYILKESLNKTLEEFTLSKQKELDSINKQVLLLEEEREQILKHQDSELAIKDKLINTLSEKLEQTLTEKQKQDLRNANLQTELTNEATQYQTTIKDLHDKINELEEKIALNHELFKKELESSCAEKDTTKLENLNLLEKLKFLENIKLSLEEKLLSNEICKQDIQNLNEEIKQKNKIIDDNQSKIKQLDDSIIQTKNEYQIILKEKEEEIKELSKVGEERMKIEKLSLEEKTKVLLDEKEKENSLLHKKNKDLENMKINLEKQLDANKSQEQNLKKLNEIALEKAKIIEDNNLKIEQLNNLVLSTKHEYETKLQEKKDEIIELSKSEEEKLKFEKERIEIQNKAMLDEKEKENSNLLEKINILENTKENLHQKQLEINNAHETIITDLKKSVEDKTKVIDDNNSIIEQLNSKIVLSKEEFNVKLNEKENKIVEFIKTEENKCMYEKLVLEKNTKIMLEEKDKEILNLMEKLNILENTNVHIEKQLEINKTQEYDITKLKNSVEEKMKIIEDNNSKIEQLNNLLVISKNEFNVKLNEKEDKFKEILEIEENKFMDEKLTLEKSTKTLLEEKNKEFSNLNEKLNTLEDIKLNFEKQLEINKTQENNINNLKKEIEEKSKAIDDNNSKIELLNNVIVQNKINIDEQLREKENEIDELVKSEEQKLMAEKIAFDTCLNEKNTKILVLKSQLQELKENNTEKELMFKLESVVNELEKEKIKSSSLEKLKYESDKAVLEHKTELQLLESSTNNMTKAYEEQLSLNSKMKNDFEQLDGERLKVQKQIDKLKIECSTLLSTLDEKNNEIKQIKAQSSHELKTIVSDSDELNRLKCELEKDRSTRSHLEFRIQELTDENHHLNERIECNLLQKDQNMMQEKYNVERKYEETYSMLKIKENQILVLQTELNSWKLKDMSKSKNNNAEGKTDKSEAHLLAEKNEEIKMLNSIILGLHKKLSAVMETDVSDFEIEKNPSSVSKEDYQKLYKTAKNNVKLKDCENLSLKQEVYKLKTENDHYSEFKTKCESLENDKKILQKIIVNYESSHLPNVKNEKNDNKSETEKILEEKDWQINLLNKIIADLHSKVSDNKLKIEALEKQILDSGVDQNKKIRIRTTRLYCERCEIFDSHDYEDCPEKPESPKFQKKLRVVNDSSNRTIEEPFCICCDMFGHTANECDNSLTY